METQMGRDLPRVRADKGQIENAVMNLVVNARDAVRGNGGGMVRLAAARITATDASTDGVRRSTPTGDLAMIEVSDDGPGIPHRRSSATSLSRSSPRSRRAKGQAWALPRSMASSNSPMAGSWRVRRRGRGAVFRVFLPEHIPPLAIEAPPAAEPAARRGARSLWGGPHTVRRGRGGCAGHRGSPAA